MTGTKLDVVTAERVVYSGEVDMVVAPGVDGQLGILPEHAPLMTMLEPGELRIKKGSEEISLAITGGFIEVRPDRVVVLADAAERAEEIDIKRAEEAKKRAQDRLAQKQVTSVEQELAEAALRRALTRLRIADRVTRRKPTA